MYANVIARFFIEDVNTIRMHQHVSNLSIKGDVAESGRLVVEEENVDMFSFKNEIKINYLIKLNATEDETLNQ